MHVRSRGARRPTAAFVTRIAAALFLVSGCFPELPLGTPGRWDYQSLAEVEVPGAVFNAAALNTRFEHRAFSIDTKVGPRKTFGQVYNTGTRQWRAFWEMHYDGATFVDHLGTVHDLAGVPIGTAIPGSHWVLVDADTVKTKGGLRYHFDAQGRLAAETWSVDAYPQLAYAWGAGSLRIEECVSPAQQQRAECRPIATIRYGPHGPVEIVDEVSAAVGETRRARYGYTDSGHVSEAHTPRQDAESLPGTRYEYAPHGLLSAQVLPGGERIEYDYAQTHLRLVRQVGEGDPRHRFDYFADGGAYEVVHTSPTGGRTRYVSTRDGEVTRIVRVDLPTPEVMTVDWHPGLRRPSAVRSFDGSVRRFPTWTDDDPTTIVEPSGNAVVYAYAPDAVNHAAATRRAVAEIRDDLGPVLSISYDPTTGLPQQRTNGEGETTSFVHLGDKLVESTTPWGETTELLSFGASGHWREAAVSSSPEIPIRRKFDLVGNPIVPAAGLQRGGVLEKRYDRDRRLRSLEVAATDRDGLVTATGLVTFDLRGDGQALAIRRPLGADHELEYDALGRVRRVCERVGGGCRDTFLAYDAAGRRTAIERANGMREELDYDPYGRPTAHRAYRGSALQGEATMTWEDGHVVSSSDSIRGETRTLVYQPGTGRLRTQGFSAHGETHVLDYDARSRVVRETFIVPPPLGGGEPAVLVIGYAYDLADRLVRVHVVDGSAEGELLREWEIEDGRIARVRDGNGTVRETLFDPETSERVGYEMRDAGGVVIEETTIRRSIELGPARLQVAAETVTALAATEEEYWLNRPGSLLDPDGKVGMRVFRARGWDDGVLAHDRRYAWDALGNVSDNAAGDGFVYNGDRTRLLQAGGAGWSHSYQYDEAGYVTSRDGLEIAWTATGRVARVGPPSLPLAEATWDLSGALVSITTDGETREFTCFGGRVEWDAAAGGPGWLHLGDVSLPFTGSARRHRHDDFRGNTSVVADENGSIVSHRRHHAFGIDRVHGTSGSGGSSLLEQLVLSGFAGGVAAQGLGLSFNGARVLDTDTGRFLSPDPILHAINQVTYALGNPIGFEDRNGLHEAPSDGVSAGHVVAFTVSGSALVASGIALMVMASAFNSAAIGAVAVAGLGVVGAGIGAASALVAFSYSAYLLTEALQSDVDTSATESSGAQVKVLEIRGETENGAKISGPGPWREPRPDSGGFAPVSAAPACSTIALPGLQRDREATPITLFLLSLLSMLWGVTWSGDVRNESRVRRD